MAATTRFETDRLILRVFEPRDLDDIHGQVYSDPDVCRMYCGDTRTVEESRDWLHFRITEAKFSEFHAFAAELKEIGKVIGLVRLGPWARDSRFPDEVDDGFNPIDVEMSFAFGRDYWGKGYAYEACLRVIDYAFDELRIPRLVGGASAENERSIALHRRLGYRVDYDPRDGDIIAMLVNTRPPKALNAADEQALLRV